MKHLIFTVFLGLVFSCEKDKTPLPCTGISMTGEKSRYIGKWRWYKTIVQEWFDIGNPIYHDYTPQNQQFDYYFTISADGTFKGYRYDTLVDSYILSGVELEIFQGSSTYGIELQTDCTAQTLTIYQYAWNVSNDSIFSLQYPLNFKDDENHLESLRNFFVKE